MTSCTSPRFSSVRRCAIASPTAARFMKPSMRSHGRDQRIRSAIPHDVVTPSRMASRTSLKRTSWWAMSSFNRASSPTKLRPMSA